MALIEVFHTIATQLPTSATDIVEGMGVKLSGGTTSEATVVRVNGASDTCFGIAADSAKTTGPNKPYGASLVVNGLGTTRATQNRVSDFFNETVGSGKMTVYTGIGEFYTDQYESGGSYQGGTPLFVSANGKLTNSDGNGNCIGIAIDGPRAYPSGVPGVDDAGVTGVTAAVNGSLSLGTFLRFYMNIVPLPNVT
jgi:hypothetical protein